MSDEEKTTLDAILERRRRQTNLIRALVAFVAVGAVGIFFWLRGADSNVEPMPDPMPPAAEVEPAPAAPVASVDPVPPTDMPLEAEVEPLPALAESDSRVRTVAARLSSRPELISWLASDELVRRIAAGVDAIAQGDSPAEQAPASMRPKGKFEVLDSGAGSIAAPASAARYDLLTEIALGLDADALVRARRELAPLFEEAHRDLGSSNASFDAAIRRAIVELLSTPIITGQPLLEPLMPGYAYVDPALEELSDAKKQLLRFGPTNVSRLQQKLREIALRLGIPESDLPSTPAYAVPTEPVSSPTEETPAAEAARANP
jgi:hypothetical protein